MKEKETELVQEEIIVLVENVTHHIPYSLLFLFSLFN